MPLFRNIPLLIQLSNSSVTMAPKRGVKRGLSKIAAEEYERSPKQTKLSPSTVTVSDEVQVPSAKATTSRASASKKSTPAFKLYKDTIKAVDKTFKPMVKSYKPNPKAWYGIVSEVSNEHSGGSTDEFL